MGRGGSRTGGAGLAAYLLPKNDYKSCGQRRQILEYYQMIVLPKSTHDIGELLSLEHHEQTTSRARGGYYKVGGGGGGRYR